MFDILIAVGSGFTLLIIVYGLGLTKRPKGYIDFVRGVKDPTIKEIVVEKRIEVIVKKDSALDFLSEGDVLREATLRKRMRLLYQTVDGNPGSAYIKVWLNEAEDLQAQADAIRLKGLAKMAVAQKQVKND